MAILSRFLLSPFRLVGRRPLLSFVSVAMLVGAAVFGVWRYALVQWDKAQVALTAHELPEAWDHLTVCLRVWPRSPEVHLAAARVARLAGDLKGAEDHLNRCLELEGPTDPVRIEFLLLRVQAGEVDELAPFLFKSVEDGNPDYREILTTIARAYILRLRYKLAFACLSKWIELEPTNARPYHWRGWCLERLSNQKGARADYDKALELDPDLVPVRLRVAEMLLEDKQAQDALPHLERLRAQVPDDAEVMARLGICYFLLGRGDEARKLMEDAQTKLPDDPALLVALANQELQNNRPAEAEKWLRQVLAVDASDTESLFLLSSALELQGRTKEAAEAMAAHTKKRDMVERINVLLKDKTDNPNSTAQDYTEIGRLFYEIGRDKYGTYWLEQALEKDPTYEPARKLLAENRARQADPPAPPPG